MLHESEMNYTQYINFQIKSHFSKYSKSVIFGQNIIAGSRISGLGNGIEEIDGALTLNTTNSENSLMGMGFGLSLSGIPSLFLMKQHDFALLGIDHLVNTNNLLRQERLKSPFIVLMVVVDTGYEGPQASLNSLDEFASISKSPVYFLSTKESIDIGFEKSQTPGLHLMALGQANLKKKLKLGNSESQHYPGIVMYENEFRTNSSNKIAFIFFGVDVDIVVQARNILIDKGVLVDLFLVCELTPMIISAPFITKLKSYNKVIVADTGKSEIHFSTELIVCLLKSKIHVVSFQRKSNAGWFEVSSNAPEFTSDDIIKSVFSGER